MSLRPLPLSDYALIGDCRSAALVSKRGSIDFLCWPRFDSPALFAALLDPGRGGRFRIEPAGVTGVRRAYLPDTNVLVTRFACAGGELELTDLMPALEGRDARTIPLPEHELLRLALCTRGEVEVEVELSPRPDFGREAVRFREVGRLGLRARTGAGELMCRSTHPLQPGTTRVRLSGGERLCISLGLANAEIAVLPPLGAFSLAQVERTAALWRGWSARTRYDGPWRDAVVRSALALKLLAYAPSGAIVAAPTTSLPERPGGALNWDYRFCWLRDAALTSRALFGLGHEEEAEGFIDWLLNATSLTRPKLRVLYDVFGRRPPRERELDELAGYGGARPVRVGNAASDQVQLDLYGEVIEAAAFLLRCGRELDRTEGDALVGFGRQVAEKFDRPDQGIWEVRGPGSDFTHSRVLCWTALDRLLELDDKGHLRRTPRALFEGARARIRAQVERDGFSDQLGSYTRTLGGADVDAALLLLPWYGYADAKGARMQGTWRRIHERLFVGRGLFRRYQDGELTRGEGAFGICSAWASEFLAGAGDRAGARALLEELLGFANDVGLLAEEIDPASGELWGNFPQAYTHVGVISAALALQEPSHGRSARSPTAPVPEARP